MRGLSATSLAILGEDRLKAFLMVKLDFPSVSYYFTDYGRDVDFGGNTYSSGSGVMDFEPPRLSYTVDREAYRLSISDHNNTFQNLFRLGATGSDVTIYLVLVGSGGPELGADDVIVAYKGRIDETTIVVTPEDKVAVITLSSPMANLDQVKTFWTTKSGMDQYSATDTSFDNIYEDNKEITLKWGKV